MESENQAAYWDITASIDQIYDETTLCLTVSTQKAAKTDSPRVIRAIPENQTI